MKLPHPTNHKRLPSIHPFRSLFAQLILSHVTLVLLIVLALGLFLSFAVRTQMLEVKRHDLMTKGSTAAAIVDGEWRTRQTVSDVTLSALSELLGAQAWVMLPNGQVLAGKPPVAFIRAFQDSPDDYAEAFEGVPQSWQGQSRRNNIPALITTMPLPSFPAPAALFFYTPITGVHKAVEVLDQLMIYALEIGSAIALLLGFFISRRLTRSLSRISQAAEEFSRGNFHTATHVYGHDEVSRLAAQFDSMAESLATQEEQRRDFLANLSHEIKTPVAAIQALSEALLDNMVKDPDQKHRYLSSIVTESRRIDRLLKDLLDLSQLEAGELSLSITSIDPIPFLHQETTNHFPIFEAASRKFLWDIPDTLAKAQADPDRLHQIFANLLSNALRYAPVDSTVTLTASESDGWITFAVTNTGPGISPEDLPHIWDRFYRADKARSKDTGGTGLGLFISRTLAHAMGGKLTVSSTPGILTTFTLYLSKSPSPLTNG